MHNLPPRIKLSFCVKHAELIAFMIIGVSYQSLCTGIFPYWIKLANVIPLQKDDNKLCGYHRPISLLSSLSKVFEKIVLNQLYDYKRFVIRKPIRFQKTTLYRVSRFRIDGPNPPRNGSKQNTIFFTLTLIEGIWNFKPSHIIVKTRISWG